MIELYTPQSLGEWLSFASAAITVLFGLFSLGFARSTLSILRLQTKPEAPEALSESRGTIAGFYLGVGITTLLFAQPFLMIALGAGWAFTAFGRLVSMVFDRGFTRFNFVSLALEILLAAGPLLYVFGYIS